MKALILSIEAFCFTPIVFCVLVVLTCIGDMLNGRVVSILLFMGLLVGVLFNAMAIYFNDGKMPVINMRHEETETHKLLTTETRVRWACDIFKLRLLGVTGRFSIGDVLLVLFGFLIWTAMIIRIVTGYSL